MFPLLIAYFLSGHVHAINHDIKKHDHTGGTLITVLSAKWRVLWFMFWVFCRRLYQRTTIQPDELSSEAQRSSPRLGGEEEKAISTFEEAFRQIKEATGVTDTQVQMLLQTHTHTLYMGVFMWLVFTYMVALFGHVCVWVGDSGALHLTEGDTPTSGEAEGREWGGAAAAEGAEGAPEPTVPAFEIFWRG